MRILDRYDLFIFDWDNTLSTSTLPVNFAHNIKRAIWRPRKRSKWTYTEPSGAKIALEEDETRVFAVLYDLYASIVKPKLKRDAIELLEYLRKSGKKVAIFSDARSYRLLRETRLLGAAKYMDFMLSAETAKSYKPNPSGLLLINRRFRVPKSRCIYIGDMYTDVVTAKLAGMASCCVYDGLDPYAEIARAAPDYAFPDLRRLIDKIGKDVGGKRVHKA